MAPRIYYTVAWTWLYHLKRSVVLVQVVSSGTISTIEKAALVAAHPCEESGLGHTNLFHEYSDSLFCLNDIN